MNLDPRAHLNPQPSRLLFACFGALPHRLKAPRVDLATMLTSPSLPPTQIIPSSSMTSAEVTQLRDELSSSKRKIEHVSQLLGESEEAVERFSEQAKVRLRYCKSNP